MQSIRVLHIASFSGNIGDNASHQGFRPWFEKIVGQPISWFSLEIREFYWRERLWDQRFVELANSYDLVVIGGGNYFELWVEQSPTGTSIALEPALLRQIKTPIFFNALGVDPGQGVPPSSKQRFTEFLDYLLSSSQFFVTVRNDGAKDNLRNHIGNRQAEEVHLLPDHGFFATSGADHTAALLPLTTQESGHRTVAINLANDMPEVRFAQFNGDQGKFLDEFAATLKSVSTQDPSIDFVLVPHIFRDLEIVSQLLTRLPDRLRRTRVAVAPFGSGSGAANVALQIYSHADIVLGMRFHANVCPIGMGLSTIGLASYQQIPALYKEIGQADRVVNIGAPGFGPTLEKKLLNALNATDAFALSPNAAIKLVREQRQLVEPSLHKWLDQAVLASN